MDKIFSPTIAFVLITPDNLQRLSGTMESLKKQTIAKEIELFIVARKQQISLEELNNLKPYFLTVQVVEREEVKDVTSAGAAVVPYVTAPITAFLEDHVYIQEDYATQLVAAHEGEWAAVGPNFHNANPGNSWSWANLILYYGTFTERIKSEEVFTLPMNNISYKTVILRSLSNNLEQLMSSWSGGLNNELQNLSFRLYYESKAVIYHRNFVEPTLLIKMALAGGQIYGSRRAKATSWSRLKKLVYAIGSPLFPFIRIYKIWKEMSRSKRMANLVIAHAVPLFIQLIFDAIGQAKGYLFGIGESRAFIDHVEMGIRTDVTIGFQPVQALMTAKKLEEGTEMRI